MATYTRYQDSWNWFRVGAWSGSFATHVGILLLVALPIAAPLTRIVQEPIQARWIEDQPPPALPEPPPPMVPHHVKPKSVAIAAAQMPTPVHDEASVPATPLADQTIDPSPAPRDAPAPGGDIGAGGATQELAYATPLRPPYPPSSLRAREQGIVLLRVLVDENGMPQKVEIARSSGHSRLDASARDSVAKARFRPVMRGGKAVPVWGIVPIAFRLDSA
jgi:protein TonB